MAVSFKSPGTYVNEIDQSLTTVSGGSSTGAGVIAAGWGPVLTPQLIDSEATLVNVFGQPNDQNYKNWMSIANFLAYTSSCYVVRLETENQFNANAKGLSGYQVEQFENSRGEMVNVVDENGDPVKTRLGVVINNDSDYSANYENGNGDYGEFVARYPGKLGNSIMVTYADSATFDQWQWTDDNGGYHDWTNEFSGAPGTSRWAAARSGSNDEIHILVIDAGGDITGTKGAILEKYAYLSKSSDARDLDGMSSNYKNVLRDQSQYVYWMDYPQSSSVVPQYNHKVRFIGDTEAIEAVTNIAAGDMIINTQTNLVMVGSLTYTIDDDGVRRPTVVLNEYCQLSDWADKQQLIFNTTDNKVYQIHNTDDGIAVDPYTASDVMNWGSSVVNTTFASLIYPYVGRLSGGTDDYDYSDGDEISGWDIFNNREAWTFGLCITGAATPTVAKYVIENICESRMDCVAFVSPTSEGRAPFLGAISNEDRLNGVTSSEIKILNQTLAYRTQSTFNVNSSYGHLDSGWKYQFDKYSDCNRWVPLNGDCAGLYAQTDETNNPWTPAAGYNRGQIKNVIKLNYSPNKTHRDQLYQQQINPVVSFAGEGTILYGSKSLQTKPSALDRLNVRRLLIYLETSIEQTCKYLLFELNTASTRAYAVNVIEPILKTCAGNGGLQAYKVVCDTSNNTADIIDSNTLAIDIYVQPSRSIDFINLSFIIEKTGSSTVTESM